MPCSLGGWRLMSTVLAGVIAAVTVTMSPDPARGEARFQERGGVLYVTNVDRPAAQAVAAPTTRPARATLPVRSADAFRHLIREAAARYAVAPELIESVIRVESNFEPRAVSSKGARGLMQLMPATARLLGVQDSFDIGQNIDGGARHLRNLIDRYNGSLPLALAAYNAGAEAVARYGGIPRYAETQAYVARILQLVGRGDELAAAQGQVIANGSADGELHRYQAADGALVYSNIPVDRLSGAERAMLERRQ
jgi:transglycosylase-like protein with SLT domain